LRVLAVSDLHYSLKQLDWIVAAAADYDLVVLAGDLLDIRSYVEPDAQIAVVREYLARFAAKTTVVACSGNHDLNADNDLGERAATWLAQARDTGVYVDGMSLVTDDAHLTVCPWWDGPRTRERFAEALVAEAPRVGDRLWIWVYHAPPDRSPTSWTGSRYYGDGDLNAWIGRYAPALVLTGHVHQSPFADDGGWADVIGSTVVVNAGREPGPVPAHVVIDTDDGRVQWRSSAAAEERAFASISTRARGHAPT